MRLSTFLPTLFMISWGTLISAQNIHNTTAIAGFLNCLGDSVNNYKFNIEDGEILVMPADNRSPNCTTRDNLLLNCIMRYHNYLNIVLYGSTYSDDTVTTSFVGSELSDRLAGHGVSTVPNRRRSTGGFPNSYSHIKSKLRRQAVNGYYQSYPATDDSCEDNDQQSHFAGECPSYQTKYTSIEFYNPEPQAVLTAYVWPHHDCQKGNEKGYVASPFGYTSCPKRDTYSWKGSFTNAASPWPCIGSLC
ncbi:hypothetical protein I302_101588 [Kwoniella bestiolae CBS 10118]|uniref:Secreted protein n=1 Tax=Kwoniella bestiolae CBS 10118 TaxID=1296100 RepID=A0A1B9GCN1_9TREE|nr:hypothetical protein I302_00270 [Kwoniella bestiolae CBS 10118]OCF28781.1 hypothetical protein I302_00270 [Kwoniella bestiolae CBS 10118]